ncbi:Tyrosine-protein phosphatase [Halioglobus japonicus]|nr:Tyrosine-protein phosphatase [Halioglobus japonicus]
MLISEAVQIWREADGDYHIEWQASHPDTQVTVEPLSPSGSVSAHYSEDSQRIRMSGLAPTSRHYFRLRDQHGTEVLAAERKLGMQGTPNFRDFGGYPTVDGRQVKWGFLFRSGQLSSLSDQDVDLLASLELDLVCDFRRQEEQEGDPSRLPSTKAPRIASLPIIPGSNAGFFEQIEGQAGDRQAMFDFMVEINRDFAEAQTATYARMFQEILSVDDARFLVHCAAGKDRTGFAAAMVLMALGVSRDVVMRDYMLTGQFFHPEAEMERLRKKYQMHTMAAESILPMLEVHEDYLARALLAIEQSYPSTEVYLQEALGVGAAEVAELRARYLD